MTETWKKARTEKACAQPETPLLPCAQGGEPGLGTPPTSTVCKPPHVLTIWEVRDSYPATDLLPSLGQVSSPFHASKQKLHSTSFTVASSNDEPVRHPSSASAPIRQV